MKILKFGGNSLKNGEGITNTINIIENNINNKQKIAVVVSARGNTTNELEEILEKSATNQAYLEQLKAFKAYQITPNINIDYSEYFSELEQLLKGVSLLGSYNQKIKDKVLAVGELLSAKLLVNLLHERNIKAEKIDSRKIIKTDDNFGNAIPNHNYSRENTRKYFSHLEGKTVGVVTGFIGSNSKNETTTLGRNGSNYTASLLASYLEADELLNYTHVDGIYTADPNLVNDAVKIDELSFSEANELANFGANILHAKTIIPLIEKNINLRILNTFNPNSKGTLITRNSKNKGVKSLTVLENVSLLNFEGKGLLGTVGIDARVFKTLSDQNISVSIISQGSSERGLGFVIDSDKTTQAIIALEHEFEKEFYTQDVHKISVIDNIAVLSIIGLELSKFHLPYSALINNQITPILFNNTTTGKNISLVIKKEQLHKAVNVIHGQIFNIAKKINIAVFGKGLVGKTFINQILENRLSILDRKKVQLNIFSIADSNKLSLYKNEINKNWALDFKEYGKEYNSVSDIISFAKENHLENLIAVDNTASENFIENYIPLVNAGFDLVSSNKIANTISYNFYKELRTKLNLNNKSYLYETNVGAGLPLIDTINLLHESGENITKIKGVFSGSLSYLFNRYSTEDIKFSEALQEAIDKGFTEPDPREDLCGNDVARKLLILARELDLINEFEDIQIENLIPEELRQVNASEFLSNLDQLNAKFQQLKKSQKENHVLRYIGELSGDLSEGKGKLTVKLVSVPNDSTLGSLRGSDVIFEIFTESYGEQPIVIQGAGAGAKVTARGVFGDVLRLTK